MLYQITKTIDIALATTKIARNDSGSTKSNDSSLPGGVHFGGGSLVHRNSLVAHLRCPRFDSTAGAERASITE
jgi:hypothetical protein